MIFEIHSHDYSIIVLPDHLHTISYDSTFTSNLYSYNYSYSVVTRYLFHFLSNIPFYIFLHKKVSTDVVTESMVNEKHYSRRVSE